MRPILEEILRARAPIQPHALSRWQREIRATIGPDLEELDALRAPTPQPEPKSRAREASA